MVWVKRTLWLLLTLFVGGVALLHFLHLRLQAAHLRHRLERLVDERKHQD